MGVSDLSVRAANDISVFPSNLAALRAILKQFYTSPSVCSEVAAAGTGRGVFSTPQRERERERERE